MRGGTRALATAAFVTAAALACAPAAVAAGDPAAATVMIRVRGEITAALGPDMKAWRPSVELQEVQIGTGSGFIVSPAGYIVTNSHVIRGRQAKVTVEGQLVELTISVRAIYVVVPPRPGDAAPPQPIEAAVVADDPAVDLAILHIGSQDLPVAALGDAMVLSRGDTVSALGYPLGDRLAVTGAEGGAPPVSASTGTLAALREGGAAGLPAAVPYVQFTAPINPGNSGGPLTDRDGYVVGVVQAKLKQAEGVSLAISVEEVKRFLERTGIDATLPVTRLAPGSQFELAEKGIRARLPAGFSDASRARTRIDSGDSLLAVRLLIDRAASAWDLPQVERALLDGAAFGEREFAPLSDRLRDLRPAGGVRFGLASRQGDAVESRMVYAVFGVGGEVVVARFVGPADDLAFNLSLLRESLLSIEAAPLAPRPLAAPLSARMASVPADAVASPVRVAPAGTVVDGAMSAGCRGLPGPERSLVVTPASDFTVRFVATGWPAGTTAEQIRRACLGATSASGALRSSHLGLAWIGERAVVTTSAGEPVLLELWAPKAKFAFAREAFLAWGVAVSAR
jgi:S1-C subfamily serine protease